MKLSELMNGKTPSAEFEGFVMADDMVLAVDTSSEQNATVPNYSVVQMGLKSTSASLNPESKTSSYIRAGKSTVKTGNQRKISWEADRYCGDDFQDYALSETIKYATGQGAVVNYVFFNILTGKGEKGTGTLIVDTDASGNAEENLAVSGSLEKTGAKPESYTWSAT